MSAIEQSSAAYRFGPFRLEPDRGLLLRHDQPVPLTPKTFDALLYLLERSGRLVTKDDLMKALWAESFVGESNLTQTIFMVRKALSDNGDGQSYITTVPGRGYRFDAEVERGSGGDRAAGVAQSSFSAPATDMAATQPPPKVEILVPEKRGFIRYSKPLLATAAVIVVVAVAGYFAWLRSEYRPSQTRRRIMLAVLPFQNLTGDASQEYFSDGLTEEMLTQLGNLDPQRLAVIARTSVMHYKNSPTPMDQIGRELGVQYVVEGSVRRDANHVRVTAQLIQTKDQTHVWARQYDRELKGLLALQGEIAQEIADEIQLTLGDHKAATQAALSPPQNYDAYDLYLKGKYFFNKRTVEGFDRAIDYYQQAIAKDPNYARAYAGLADSYSLLTGYSGAAASEYMPKARAAALRALDLDASLPEAHTALALVVQNYDYDWHTAEKEFRRSIELNPNDATAHHWYAEHLMWQGRFDEALRESERARQLDPLSLIIATDNAAILYFSRQYDQALEKLHTVLELDPSFPRAAGLTISAHEQKGMFAEALADLERWHPLYRSSAGTWSEQAYIYGLTGQRAKAQFALTKLEELGRRQRLDPFPILRAHIGMGNKDQAFAYLEKAYSQHSSAPIALKVDPMYDPLRGDPRFQDLVRRVGLAN